MIQRGKIVFSGAPAELKRSLHSASLKDAYIELLTDEKNGYHRRVDFQRKSA